MSSGFLQISTEFTEHSIAKIASECEWPSCDTIIQPGGKQFYLAPEGKPNSPGHYVCQPCFQHYLVKCLTTACVVPTATASTSSGRSLELAKNYLSVLMPFSSLPTMTDHRSGLRSTVDMSVIHTMLNESQRQGNFDNNLNLQIYFYLTESYPGSHTPQGCVMAVSQHISIPHAQVTAVSQHVSWNPAPNVPTINNPSFFQN